MRYIPLNSIKFNFSVIDCVNFAKQRYQYLLLALVCNQAQKFLFIAVPQNQKHFLNSYMIFAFHVFIISQLALSPSTTAIKTNW